MRWIPLALALALIAWCVPTVRAAKPLPALRADGSKMVDANGRPVVLRGCNLGNWLLIEAWMLGWDVPDQESLIRILTERFGPSEADRLMTAYRDGFIRPRDLELVRSFEFNVVRLPFDSRMLMDESGTLRPDGFKWLDRGLEMAEEAGIYVILDMHGAPGGQSNMDHTGLRDQNKLWSEPANQDRMVELWTRLAERYKDRTVVAAYDLLNEPYGDFRQDVRPALRELMPRITKAIRTTGDRHVVIFPNALGAGFGFYEPPASQGLEQVGFTDHYYAGMFGSPSTVRSHASILGRAIPEGQAFADRVGGPVLIGEFNVVLEKTGGKPMLRHYFDEFAKRGWMATMWSYKLLKPTAGVESDNWYLVTNAQTLPKIDFRTSSLAEIEGYFNQLGAMPLALDETLREVLTSATPPEVILPTLEPVPTQAPKEQSVGTWRLMDVDTDSHAGLVAKDKSVSITAAGSDIFGGRDSFTFLQQPSPRKAMLTATVDHLVESGPWAKAGAMIRFGHPASDNFASAPMMMVNTFADGGIALVTREREGAKATETKRIIGPLPRKLSLVRDGAAVSAYVDNGEGGWIKLGSMTFASDLPAYIGLAVTSQSATGLTRADFSAVELRESTTLSGRVTAHASPRAKAASSTITLADWFGWGEGFQAVGGKRDSLRWSPSAGAGESGKWQEFKVTPGRAYALSFRARRIDDASQSQSLTASFEATVDGKQVGLHEKHIDVNQLETGDGWSLIHVEATALSENLRILLRSGVSEAGGDSALLIEDIALAEVSDR